MLCEIFEVSKQTLNDNIESLVNDGEISCPKFRTTEKVPASDGELGLPEISGRRINIEDASGIPHPTTIYNLEVLNKLGMCCFRGNKKAKEIRNKFNDVLVKAETQAPMQISETDSLRPVLAYNHTIQPNKNGRRHYTRVQYLPLRGKKVTRPSFFFLTFYE